MAKIFIILSLLLLIDASWGLTDTTSIKPGEFPSYAAIAVKLPAVRALPVCGGVILNEYYILAAGQCDCVSLKPTLGELIVKVGMQKRLDIGDSVQILDVEKVIINKNLKFGLFLVIKKYDIALIKVARPITFNKRVQPAVLPAPGSVPTGKATVVGLGATSAIFIPSYPDQIQQIEVQLVDRQECSQTVRGYSFLNKREMDKQICSLPLNKKATACKGDSGNPLYQTQNGKQVVIGLLTWAPFPCRQTNAPIIYTSVADYIDWINEHMEKK